MWPSDIGLEGISYRITSQSPGGALVRLTLPRLRSQVGPIWGITGVRPDPTWGERSDTPGMNNPPRARATVPITSRSPLPRTASNPFDGNVHVNVQVRTLVV